MTALDNSILQPVFALAAWTGAVLILMAVGRIRAGLRGQIKPQDFALGESANVPAPVSLINRNYMNLLELPILFYLICLIIYIAKISSGYCVNLAWAYVGLRIVHSLIHLTYNQVMHRLAAFALSNAALVALWLIAGSTLFSSTH